MKILKTYPHSRQFFTQGLTFMDPDTLLESVGLYGRSALYKYLYEESPATILQNYSLPRQFFAEGMTYIPSLQKIYQGTWLNKKLFIYNNQPLSPEIVNFPYTCWGLAYDSETHQLILSNGTRFLYFLDPENFALIRRLTVKATKINEIECWEKYILANIWREDKIVVFDKTTGEVIATWNLSALARPHRMYHKEAVLNGIAIHPEKKTLFVTGKWWDTMYELENPLLSS